MRSGWWDRLLVHPQPRRRSRCFRLFPAIGQVEKACKTSIENFRIQPYVQRPNAHTSRSAKKAFFLPATDRRAVSAVNVCRFAIQFDRADGVSIWIDRSVA